MSPCNFCPYLYDISLLVSSINHSVKAQIIEYFLTLTNANRAVVPEILLFFNPYSTPLYNSL